MWDTGPKGEGAVLTARAKAWCTRLVAGYVDQEESTFLIGGETSLAGSGAEALVGMSRSLGRSGYPRAHECFEYDYTRFLG